METKNYTIKELDKMILELTTIKDNKLKAEDFPYLGIFKKSTNAGEEGEELLSNEIFEDLVRVRNKSYDHETTKKKYAIETKLIRMMIKGDDEYYERAISIKDVYKGYKLKTKKYGGKISTSTFQQIKPKEFEYLLAVVLFKDGMDIFILPSNLISKNVKKRESNMAYLSGQHKGNDNEGQLNYNDEVLNSHYLLSIYNDGKNLYDYNREHKLIGKIFTKKKIEDIINEKFCI
jgi:hypothetical protein